VESSLVIAATLLEASYRFGGRCHGKVIGNFGCQSTSPRHSNGCSTRTTVGE
jgi:hypothetical protein